VTASVGEAGGPRDAGTSLLFGGTENGLERAGELRIEIFATQGDQKRAVDGGLADDPALAQTFRWGVQADFETPSSRLRRCTRRPRPRAGTISIRIGQSSSLVGLRMVGQLMTAQSCAHGMLRNDASAARQLSVASRSLLAESHADARPAPSRPQGALLFPSNRCSTALRRTGLPIATTEVLVQYVLKPVDSGELAVARRR
jgi:hypothetical protein